MSSSDKEFEEQLTDAGNKLTDPPSDVDQLLPLLDKAEYYLAKVEQSPRESTLNALAPYLKALVADKLMKHSNTDVKVAVASCISEITRITAPDAPFDDEQMKGAFELIVSSFEHLDDNSSRSYDKRTMILETVAKVRSCVVMLDLECDALILKMFEHFLKGIRDHHPENVFSLMETIMTLVIEESEDISPELLSPILSSLKKDSEDVLPIAKKLAEKVLKSCALKLKPYLGQALESLGTSADDYTEVVGFICRDDDGEKSQNDTHAAAVHEVDKEAAAPKSFMDNGACPAECDILVDSNSGQKQVNAPRISRLKITGMSANNKVDNSVDDKEAKAMRKSSKATKKRGKKQSSMMKSTEPTHDALVDGSEKHVENQKESSDLPNSLPKPDSEAEPPSDTDKEGDVNPSSPKATGNESIDATSLLETGHHADETRPRRPGRPKKKQRLLKGPEGANESEPKANEGVEKKIGGGASNEDRTPLKVKISRKGNDATNDADVKSLKLSSKKVDATTVVEDDAKLKPSKLSSKKVDESSLIEDGSSLKSIKNKIGRPKGKAHDENEMTDSLKKDDEKKMSSAKSARKLQKDEGQPAQTPKTGSERKRTRGKEPASVAKDYGDVLVGSKIKVWWPMDRKFYEGVVDSFDAVKEKHKVKYSDGDEEILNLKKERWELIQGGSGPNEEQEVAPGSPDSSTETEIPLKKFLKMRSGQSGGKQGKSKVSAKNSSKSKTASATPDQKSQDGNATDANLEKDGNNKIKDTPNIGSKMVGLALRMTKKKGTDTEKEEDPKTPEVTSNKFKKAKSKKDEKSAVKGKSKTLKSGEKSNKIKSNGSEKVKASSSKPSESEDEKTDSMEGSEKVTESKKRKLLESSKTPAGSRTKTGTKRRKGAA